jgi:hypothetical protein
MCVYNNMIPADASLAHALDDLFADDCNDNDCETMSLLKQMNEKEHKRARAEKAATARKRRQAARKQRVTSKPPFEGSEAETPMNKRTRTTTSASDTTPLNLLPAPEESVMSPEMIQQRDALAADLAAMAVGVQEQRCKVIATGLINPTPISVSTITLVCDISGPPVQGDAILQRLGHADVMEFNKNYLGKQPVLGGTKNAFNNSHILCLTDVKPKHNMAIKLFHPRPKLHITGPTNVSEFVAVAEYGRRLLVSMSSPTEELFQLEGFRVQMINTNFKLSGDKRFKINMTNTDKLLLGLSIHSDFDASNYAGIKIKRKSLDGTHAWIMIFRSGNVLITGSTGAVIMQAYKFITDLVVQHIDTIRLSKDDDLSGSDSEKDEAVDDWTSGLAD